MKPSFALSLSFDGIRLMHRAAGGWRVVGDVALDADDMAAELEVLRKTATLLDPSGVRVKLLLPNEQIKYLSIDTPNLNGDAQRDAVLSALDGATPYSVSELAFDYSTDDDKTHIAAVAIETLSEAEAFAVEHRFHPVSFAAVPGDKPFLGEPFFGVTASASDLLEPGDVVEPDGIAVVVVGQAVIPEPAPVPEANTATEATKEEPPKSDQADTDAAPDKTASPAQDDKAEEGPEETSPEPAPALGFASRRGNSGAKSASAALGGVNRSSMPAEPKGQPVPSPSAQTAPAPAVVFEPDSSSLTAEPDEKPTKTGFLGRTWGKKAPKAEPVPPAAIAVAGDEIDPTDIGSEQDRMTVFGARNAQVRGKPRFLGLILTAALLLFLAGVAAWASVFLDDGIKLSRLFGEREPQVSANLKTPDLGLEQAEEPPEGVQLAALDPTLTEEDSAVLDALRTPVEPAPSQEMTEEEMEAKYATSGIWPRAPLRLSDPASMVDLDDLYITSIDPVSTAADAIALPAPNEFATDVSFATILAPAAAGTQFSFDDQGLVIPTAAGALSPDGYTVFLGAPPLVPPSFPTRFAQPPQDTAIRSALARIRPVIRPGDLVENTERAQLDGLTLSELAAYRPALRPQSLQEAAQEAAEPVRTDGAVALALAGPAAFENATQLAVRESMRPDLRPRNFARIVQRAQKQAPPAAEVRVASAAAVAPRVVKPKIPSKASVAKQATVKNALNLRNVNLIGVYGKPSNRRALVRLGNGRYQKVVVGDRIDGGRVSAIGDSELRYTKRGRDLVLRMPR